jgi:Fe-S oxidoreductase
VRVLFIYPNTSGIGEIPINLSYLSSILKKAGHEVRVFDISTYNLYSYRPDQSQTKAGQFKEPEKRYDLPEYELKKTNPKEDVLKLVNEFNPKLIGVTSFSTNFKLGIEFLEEIKRNFDIPTIYGGIHTNLVPEDVISEPSVDMICLGEGDELIKELCDCIENGEDYASLKNLWVKKDGKVIRNPLRPLLDLNKLPFQDFDDFENYNFYRPLAGKIYKSASVDISRGCPYQCSYCVNHTFQKLYKGLGSYHRVKSLENAISNLVNIKEKYKIELMRFWDEDFTLLPIDYFREFAREYKEKINLPFLIYSRVDSMTQDKLDLLKYMGCVTIAMGIESGSSDIRKKVLNRNMSDDKLVRVFNMVRKSGIRCSAYNMIGLPHETRKDIFKTIELNRKCKPVSSSVMFLEPYPNTQIYKDCVDNGYIHKGYIPTSDFYSPHISEKLITHKELKGLLKTFILYTKVPKIFYPLVRLCEYEN